MSGLLKRLRAYLARRKCRRQIRQLEQRLVADDELASPESCPISGLPNDFLRDTLELR